MAQLMSFLRHKALLTNSTWMTFGLGFRAVLQAIYFILIARAIGPSEYGIFVSIMALVGILSPYASWGSGNILVKYTSRDPSLFGKYWGAAIATTIMSSFVLALVAIVLTKAILPASFNFWFVLNIALAELLFARLVYISAQAFQAFERLDITAQIYILFSAARLLCTMLFINAPVPFTAKSWAYFYLGSTILSVLPVLFWVYRILGWGKISLLPMIPEMKEGFYFSLGFSSQGFYNDVDKTLLARISGNEVSGIYSVAYRMIDVAFVPVSALLNSTYARFFQHGQSGVIKTKKFAIKLLPIGLGYTILAAIILFYLSPFIPKIIGEKYTETTDVVYWLLPLLALKTSHYLFSDVLTGTGYQGVRSGIQIVIAVLNLSLNLLLIPLYGWHGAAWSSLISDGLLLMSFWFAILIVQNRKKE
jgi:O-antigen/teichoic acid export membrane protein